LVAEPAGEGVRVLNERGRQLLDAIACEADRGSGDRECRECGRVAAEDGCGERGQADLELVDCGGVAAPANRSEILRVVVLGGRCAPGEEDLAVGREVVRDALSDPVRGADEVPAVTLGELVDAERVGTPRFTVSPDSAASASRCSSAS
jgi:hypothetical protein